VARKKTPPPTAEPQETPRITTQSRYAHLSVERSPYVTRAEQASKFTIPHLFPPGNQKGATLPLTYQSVGARGVNNLAAKLLLTLVPPGGSFFRLALDDLVIEQLAQAEEGQDARAELDEALGKVERSVMNRFEQGGSRSAIFTALKHLIVTGNGLLQVLPHARLKFHPLSAYVVKRDLEGNLLELVVEECLARETLPPEVQAILPAPEKDGEASKDNAEVEVFTHVRRTIGGTWVVFQEVEGKLIPGSESRYPEDKLPFLPLRFVTVDGEDYGRGYVEEYLGDLSSLETLTAAIVDFAACASKIIYMVDESGLTSKAKLERTPSGGIIDGKAADVSVLQLEKGQDFSVARAVTEEIRGRLEQAFLLASSIQRNAERVTAEEIRVMAGELEQTLGGIYSVLAQELQLPLVRVTMAQLEREGKLPSLPKEAVAPQIVTGLEGLGRNTDLQRLQSLVAITQGVVGPDHVAEYLNVGAYLKRGATALSIDATGLIRSEEEVTQRRQEVAQQAMAEKLAPIGAQMAADQAPTSVPA
jgi:hypothetical protein